MVAARWRRAQSGLRADSSLLITPRFAFCLLALFAVVAGPLRSRGADTDRAATPRAAQAESTRKMAALLQKIWREADPMQNPFRSDEQLSGLRAKLAATTEPGELLKVKTDYALQLLQSGHCREALAQYQEVDAMSARGELPLDPINWPRLWQDEAICYLRQGEQDNCCANHNADSCIFPIAGQGIHTLPEGSRGAIAVLTKILKKYPNDLSARWLLNIAYSTLGEYPSRVPREWLIDPKCFASDYDIKRFPDVAAAIGMDIDAMAGGVVLDDFDNDGLLDIMVSSWGLKDQLRFFHNDGDGHFTERTEAAGLVGETGGLNLFQCDYNNDGFLDVLVLRGAWLGDQGKYPLSLLRNNGDGTFTDVTEEAGLLRFHPTQAAVWLDYDGDGWVDLFIADESTEDDVNRCELFHNNGDGTFTECAAACGVNLVGYFKAVASADYNNDGRPDLFLSRRDGSPILLRNDGPPASASHAAGSWRFTDVTAEAGVYQPNRSFPCWFWDYNNDGFPDIFATGYATLDVGDVAADYMHLPTGGEKAHLYRNNGDGTFTDVSKAAGLNKVLYAMSGNFGDLDNDGWLDFYVGTGDPQFSTLIPSRMFRNDGIGHFQDVTTSGGFGQLQKGHGIAFGDLNNDGDVDIYSVVGGAVPADHFHHQIFANPGHGNAWIKLKLEGVKTNRAAMGARIKLVVATPRGKRTLYRTVGSGGSFGASPLRQEIGLGDAAKVERAEIYWPVTGLIQTVEHLEPNRCYTVREGSDHVAEKPLKTFKWPASGTDTTSPNFASSPTP